ncbi:MAG: DUF4405 domain-containing protein [Caldilineaceae bacterium]
MAVETFTQRHPRFKWPETLWNFWVDIVLFLMFIIDMNTGFTGIPIHEWLGIAFGGALLYHLLLHWPWIVSVTRRLFGRLPSVQRIRYVVNLLLFLDMVVVVATGIWISEAALPQLGLRVQPNFFWRQLHHVSSEWIVWLVGLHLALGWSWITNAWSRYCWRPLFQRNQRKQAMHSVKEGVA